MACSCSAYSKYFSVDNVFSIHYEPATRTRLTVRNVDGANVPENDSIECQWIVNNFEEFVTALDPFLYNDEDESQEPIETADIIRDSALQNTDWLVFRHQEQLLLNVPTTLSEEQFSELLNYRQALRDLGASYTLFISLSNDIVWPTKPTWIDA